MTPMLRRVCLLAVIAGIAVATGISAAQDLQLRGGPDRSEVVIGEPFFIEDLTQRDSTGVQEYTDVFLDFELHSRPPEVDCPVSRRGCQVPMILLNGKATQNGR